MLSDLFEQQFIKGLIGILLATLVIGALSYGLFNLIAMALERAKWLSKKEAHKLRAPVVVFFVLTTMAVGWETNFDKPTYGWLHAIQIAYIFTFSWAIIQLIDIGKVAFISRYDLDADDNLKARKVYTQIRVFERILALLIVMLAIALSLMTFESIRTIGTSILASAGLAGIVVGLAAQKLIGNLLAGFQLAITQPIRIRDVVVVEKEWGRIEEITLTYVVVKIWDKRRLVLPATYFIEKPFQNWTRSTADILGTIYVYADYHLPIDALREALTTIVKGTSLWDGEACSLQITNLNNHTIEARALVSAKDASTAWDLRVYVREKLITFIQQEYPHCLPQSRITINPAEALSRKEGN